jgi:hypothetical protein
MVDGTRDSLYRLPAAPPGTGGARRKQDANAPNGAGTIGASAALFNDSVSLPPFPPPKDGNGSTADGGDAPHGAPQLPSPKRRMSAADMSLQVSALMSRMDDSQSDAEQNGLKLSDQQRQEAYKKSNEQIATAAKKLAAAEHKQKILGPLATIGKIFAGIAAIALTIVTGGTAAPLAIAIIAYTAVDTACTIANAISQAAGGPALDLSSLLQDGFKEAAKACGANDKDAETIGKWCAFGVQAAIAIATIAVSIKGIVGLVKGTVSAAGSIGARLSTTAFKATKIAGIASQLVGGAATATAGGLGIATGVDNYDAQKAQADKLRYDAQTAALTQTIRNTLDRLQLLAADLSSAMKTTADDISSIGETNTAIAGGNVSMV